jgi:hypothetical protein
VDPHDADKGRVQNLPRIDDSLRLEALNQKVDTDVPMLSTGLKI